MTQPLRLAGPVREPDSRANASATLAPKVLARYGEEIANLHRLGAEIEEGFKRLIDTETELRQLGISGMSRGLAPPMNAALQRWDKTEAPVPHG